MSKQSAHICYACGRQHRPAFYGVFLPNDPRLPRAVYNLCRRCYPPTQEMVLRLELKIQSSPDYSRYALTPGLA